MEESLINRHLNKLEKHIENCPSCLARYEQLLQEQSEWSGALFQASLPASFTNQVLEALQETEIEPVEEAVHKNMIFPEKPSRRKYRNLQRWAAAAAILLILSGSLIYANPSIAEIVRSMFSSDAELDPGLEQSKKLGLIQDPDIDIRSHGYRIQVNEVSADAARLTIAVKVTDRFGKPVLQGFNWEQISVKDEQGNEIGLGRFGSGNSSVDVFTYIYKGELTSPTITVESRIDKIKGTKGNWKFSFPVDLTRADSLTTVDELNQHYVTPEGLNIQMNKLTHTPSGVKLELTTSLSQQARNNVPANREEMQKLMFHFEDEQGNIISQVNEMHSISMLAGETSKRTEQGIHWVYTFIDLPYDSQRIKMVLDGYSIPEKSEGSVVIYPSKLNKENAVFSNSGDKVWFEAFKVIQDPDQQAAIAAGVTKNQETKSAGVIKIKGEYVNMANPAVEQWQAIDDKGNKYPVEFRGSIDLGTKVQDGNFIIKGLSCMPTKLTLIRSIVGRYYSDVQWSFDLPKGRPIPGLENNEPIKYWEDILPVR
ncbi:DUF4179 domain-containing protein [Paenibacillus durus]|uniref:DUF4179 domain-containing protein n=1 Tax=Paenibacillus durus TaxID=44251 RepID=A0A089HQ47_PAEDU|nr:DUF4179 domain-containing protein [Paenibacillus durus]AIQ12483.1 hypothetical protein PDUR_11665 [Paenibacillus durus]